MNGVVHTCMFLFFFHFGFFFWFRADYCTICIKKCILLKRWKIIVIIAAFEIEHMIHFWSVCVLTSFLLLLFCFVLVLFFFYLCMMVLGCVYIIIALAHWRNEIFYLKLISFNWCVCVNICLIVLIFEQIYWLFVCKWGFMWKSVRLLGVIFCYDALRVFFFAFWMCTMRLKWYAVASFWLIWVNWYH